jgi:5-methylcytosine-specific restriction endonuclease McrA
MKLRIGVNANGYKDGRCSKIYYCIDCGKKISSYQAKRCIKCFGIWETGINNPMYGKIQDKNPNWCGGISFEPYSIDWTNILKEKIRQRDNYQCQNCSITEEEHLIVVGTNLIVHHIDYNKQNCKEDNLITVCNSCNARANFNRSYWKNIYQNKIIKEGKISCQSSKSA